MNVGDNIILKNFLGKVKSPKGTKESEDYWKLIGNKGKIIDKKKIYTHIIQKMDIKY